MILAMVAAFLCSGPAHAADSVGFRGWGPRIGLTSDPDQIHFGAHFDFGRFARHLRWQPNVEVGVGSDQTVVAWNIFEVAYRFAGRWDRWSPYLGGGMGLNVYGGRDGILDDTTSRVGVSALGGIEKGLSGGDRMFLEAKVGLDDSPDLKLTVGWTFF